MQLKKKVRQGQGQRDAAFIKTLRWSERQSVGVCGEQWTAEEGGG